MAGRPFKKTRKRPSGGRPSKYKKEFCEKLIEHMGNGLSFQSFAGVIGVNIDTLYRWELKEQEFYEARKKGEAKNRLWWEKVGNSGTVGKIKNFNSSTFRFNMFNRHGWQSESAKEIIKKALDDVTNEELLEKAREILKNVES